MGELLVVAQCEQWAAQPQPHQEHQGGQGDGEPGVGDRDRGDRAEQIGVEVRRRPAGDANEDDAPGDAPVEQDRQGHVSSGTAVGADDLDHHGSQHADEDRPGHGPGVVRSDVGGGPGEPPQGDTGQGDVPDPVAQQRQAPLNQVGAHHRGGQPHQDRHDEGPLDEGTGKHVGDELDHGRVLLPE